METKAPKLTYLTDQLIQLYSESNILTDYRGLDLHYSKTVKTYDNGVYDSKIFGSMFSNQCNCGKEKTVGVTCFNCNSKILDGVQAFQRYARINLPVFYCSELKINNLIKFLRTNFAIKCKDSGTLKLSRLVLELFQFSYDEENEVIEFTDEITDSSKCSYEGLLDIIIKYYPKLVNEYLSYVNTTLLVVPIVMRPPVYTIINGRKDLKNDLVTVIYQNIIYSVENYYKQNYDSLKTEFDKNLFNGTLRRFICKSESELSRLLLTSKQNMARTMQGINIDNSGRCTIVPAPNLKVDEVLIPRHLMYEVCKSEFIEVIKEHYNCSDEVADYMYRAESNTQEMQQLFENYINGDEGDYSSGKFVFINRQPTLYELNMMMCKVKLTTDYCMKIPMAICKSFNADFDGDTMSFYAIPKASNEYYLKTMSPRNILFYKKNHSPVFTPTHEIMQGLIIATKTIVPEKLETFDTLDDANAYRKSNRNFKWQTLFMYGETNEVTTLGREKLSELFDFDINAYIKSLDWKTDDIQSLNSKNIIPLYNQLSDKEDRLDRIQRIQEFALMLVTLSGATAPSLTQLYSVMDEDFINQVKLIVNDSHLSDKEKDVKCRVLYEAYIKDTVENFDDSVKLTITESSRAKISQLMNIVASQFNVSPDGKFHISESKLIHGMTQEDYVNLSIENRAVQDIKILSTPNGGYLTRQFLYVGKDYKYSKEFDEQSVGIKLKSKDAIGRYKLDGTIVKEKSDELVEVASIVTSTNKSKIIYKNMVPDFYSFSSGSNIGISMITSFTESLTQSALALKHGGSLFNINPQLILKAKDNVVVTLLDDFILMKSGNNSYTIPKPNNFTLNYSENNSYKNNEVIGAIYTLFTPSFILDSIVAFCGAKPTRVHKRFLRNDLKFSECYALEDGIITYNTDKSGDMHVYINNNEYYYNPDSLYYYPNGSKVKKFDRICSGILNINSVFHRDIGKIDGFYLFKLQLTELINVSSELIEFLYSILVKESNNRLHRLTIDRIINNSKSFFSSVAFANARKRFKQVTPKGCDFAVDSLSEVLLPLLMKDQI